MKKFLEKFEDKNIEDLKQAFPDYSDLFDSIVKLDQESKKDTSRQVSDEFLTLIDSVDNFLFKEENLLLLGVADRVERKPEVLESEARDILEKEIEEMSKGIDKSIIEAQIKSKRDKSQVKSRIDVDELKEVVREDYDPDEQYYGVQFSRTEFKSGRFNRILSMLNAGCKFYMGSIADNHFILFKFNENDRMIVVLKNPIIKYENIFGGSSSVLDVYILSKKQANLDVLYTLCRYAFEQPEGDTKNPIPDKDLFNAPQFIGCFTEGYFYEEANALAQSSKILDRSNQIKQAFALHFPLQYILTLLICKKIQDTQQKEGDKTYEEIKGMIEEIIKTHTFKIEGIGEIPHEPDVLTKLQGFNYLDDNLDLTSKAVSVMWYTGATSLGGTSSGFSVNPKFNAFSYYIAEVKKSFNKSKNKFYSDFNGQSVYHTGKTMSETDFALHLTTKLKKQFGFSKAKQKDIFAQKWQATQIFNDFSQYLPVSSYSSLNEYGRASEREKRGLTNVMNFTNDSRYYMYFACIDYPLASFCLNSSVYNFIVKLYSDKKIRVLGPKATASSFKAPIFFLLVDENNNLLAVMKPMGKVSVSSLPKETEGTQMDLFQQTSYFSLSTKRNPEPVWDFDILMEDITKVAMDEVENGIMIEDAGDLTNESNIEEAEEDVPTDEDTHIDADGYDQNKIDDAIKENTEQKEDLLDTITGLEQVLEGNPDDEDIMEELEQKRKEYDDIIVQSKEEEKQEDDVVEDDDYTEEDEVISTYGVEDIEEIDKVDESEDIDYEEEERLGESEITAEDIEEMDKIDESEDIDYGEFM